MNLRQIDKSQIRPIMAFDENTYLHDYFNIIGIRLKSPYLKIKLIDIIENIIKNGIDGNCSWYEKIYNVDPNDEEDEFNLCDNEGIDCIECAFQSDNRSKLIDIMKEVKETLDI